MQLNLHCSWVSLVQLINVKFLKFTIQKAYNKVKYCMHDHFHIYINELISLIF